MKIEVPEPMLIELLRPALDHYAKKLASKRNGTTEHRDDSTAAVFSKPEDVQAQMDVGGSWVEKEVMEMGGRLL